MQRLLQVWVREPEDTGMLPTQMDLSLQVKAHGICNIWTSNDSVENSVKQKPCQENENQTQSRI